MQGRARIVTIGNEKGGTGKSTVAMHVIVSLLTLGARVATMDLDARQATLTRYIENRRRKVEKGFDIGLPEHVPIPFSTSAETFSQELVRLAESSDVLVIDTPGTDHPLSRLAHAYADMLVTPMNDSLIDLDILARVNPETLKIERPSHYAEMVWEARKQRALMGGPPMEWFVLRNRLSSLNARNKREIERLVSELARRIGFRTAGGLGERVIYRELFLEGLTLLDLGKKTRTSLSMSHVAARQELRALAEALSLAKLVRPAPQIDVPQADPLRGE